MNVVGELPLENFSSRVHGCGSLSGGPRDSISPTAWAIFGRGPISSVLGTYVLYVHVLDIPRLHT